jgi:hypothetical protein
MSSKRNPSLKLTARIRLCRDVNHYYWEHLNGDDSNGHVVIENIIKIVSIFSGIVIEVVRLDFKAKHLTSAVFRWEDAALIVVRSDIDDDLASFAVVKELCHIISDECDEFNTDPRELLSDLVKYSDDVLGIERSEAEVSEGLAEIMALELLYPSEYRNADAAGATTLLGLQMLASKRRLPPALLERALAPDYRRALDAYWEHVCDERNYPRLPLGKISN